MAVIDTGVDYMHPALGGCFGPGCKVAFGYGKLLECPFRDRLTQSETI